MRSILSQAKPGFGPALYIYVTFTGREGHGLRLAAGRSAWGIGYVSDGLDGDPLLRILFLDGGTRSSAVWGESE